MMRSEKKEEKKGENVFLRMGRAGHSHNKLRNEKAMENNHVQKNIPKKREKYAFLLSEGRAERRQFP